MHSRGHALRGRGIAGPVAESRGSGGIVVVKPKNTPKEDEGEASQRVPGVLRIALMIYGISSAHFGDS